MASAPATAANFALADSDPATPRRGAAAGAGRAGHASHAGHGRSGEPSAVRCGGCAASFDVGAWHALPLVATLTGDAIATHVVKWRAGVRIEIRRCGRCARSIARTTEP